MLTAGLLLALFLFCFVWVYLKWGAGGQHSGRLSTDYTLPPNVAVYRGSASRRRTERVSLVMPIHVAGQDVGGEAFEEETQTNDLSGYGASINLSRQLRPGQEIVISRENKSRQATCRVVYEVRRQEGKHIYGVAFVDPASDLWGVCKLLTEAVAPALRKD